MDAEKSVISGIASSVAGSNVSRGTSQTKRTELLKSNILSKEEGRELWLPEIVFLNTEDLEGTEVSHR